MRSKERTARFMAPSEQQEFSPTFTTSVYRQPYFEKLGFKAGYCPEAERYHREVISLPMYPALSKPSRIGVLATLKQAIDP